MEYVFVKDSSEGRPQFTGRPHVFFSGHYGGMFENKGWIICTVFYIMIINRLTQIYLSSFAFLSCAEEFTFVVS